MHDFPSDAFGRSITLQELPFWSLVDLETLSGELRARIKEVNAKIERNKGRGIFKKRELNARTYLEIYLNKTKEELASRRDQRTLKKLRKELESSKKQIREQTSAHLKTQFLLLKFQHLLCERFGTEIIQELADEAHRQVQAQNP